MTKTSENRVLMSRVLLVLLLLVPREIRHGPYVASHCSRAVSCEYSNVDILSDTTSVGTCQFD